MGAYVLRRILTMPLVLLVLVTVSFFIMRAAPGDPFSGEKSLAPEIRAQLNEKYGLDEPLFIQYVNYVAAAATGDLGPSFKQKGKTVNEIIAETIGPTVVIGIGAIVLALSIGLVAGVIGAVRQNTWIDYSSMSVAMVGMSVPRFVTGPVLVLLLALSWKVLPVSGYSVEWQWWPMWALVGLFVAWRVLDWSRHGFPGGPDFDGGRETGSFWIGMLGIATCLAILLLASNETLILPSLTLALPFASRIARLMRAGMLEVIHQDYIRTARAKGLTEMTVIVRHALKGGMLPVVSFLGPAIAALLTGGLVVEKIFAVPGIAREFVESALNRDYTLALGTVLLYGTILVGFNLIVDIAYGFLDPRIRYD
jgi:oligopeptide transport system permease protein